MRRTRDFFKKIRDKKGMCHAKMGSIKDTNDMDLTEADIKKRWQEYTEELYKKKKIFKSPIITMVLSLIWSQTSWNVKPSGP